MVTLSVVLETEEDERVLLPLLLLVLWLLLVLFHRSAAGVRRAGRPVRLRRDDDRGNGRTRRRDEAAIEFMLLD